MFSRWQMIIWGLIAAAALAGCDKVTRARFNMIREGVSDKQEVRMTLGEPDAAFEDQWHWYRHKRHAFVVIDFDEQGIVTRKRWLSRREKIDTADRQPKPGELIGEQRSTVIIDED